MTRRELIGNIKKKKSFLCIGLDTDLDKIPDHLKNSDDPIFAFNKSIIDATQDLAVAYKPNLAFYERYGLKGWQSLERTINYLPDDVFVIADAKRGDIGNTSAYYASAFFEQLNCDAVTVAPYMGEDSIQPFLSFPGKWAIVLALTSNPGALDFQFLLSKEKALYQKVIDRVKGWGTNENTMFVVGATRAEMLAEIRKLIPDHFLLVPGVGAQGGSLADVAKYGMNADCGLLVNASRSVIYASSGSDFESAARSQAIKLQQEMQSLLEEKSVI